MTSTGFPKALVIEERALNQISFADVGDHILAGKEFSLKALNLKTVRIGDILYVINLYSNENSRLVVIDAGKVNIFDFGGDNYELLDRIITLTLSRFSHHVSVSPKWGPFSNGARRGSIFANSAAKGHGHRIYYEEKFGETDHLFVFTLEVGSPRFIDVSADSNLFRNALSTYEDALLVFSDRSEATQTNNENVVHIDPLGTDLVRGWSIDEWLDTHFTEQQRSFVEKDHKKSIRLRGAAGTGKTLALVVKFLNDLRNFEKSKELKRLCFVTHSQVTKDLVLGIIGQLDSNHSILEGEYAKGRVRTIFEICNDLMNSREHSVKPLDIDAYEGRKMQKEIISSIVLEARKTLSLQFGDESSPIFLERLMENPGEGNLRVVDEIFGEFAGVFDSEGIRPGTVKARKYIEKPLSEWLLEPRESGDRKILLEIYRRYRESLRQMGVISVDQMVVDAIGFLDSNTWDSLLDLRGYDALFVDEAHLFSTLERQALRPLLRSGGDDEAVKPMFVAYDFKQVTRVGLENLVPRFHSTAAWMGSTNRDSDRVTLETVFRFTPQIASLISDLAMTYVDTDVLDEVDRSTGISEQEGGGTPTLSVFPDNLSLYKAVFSQARDAVKSLKLGRKVCVICLDDGMFDTYRKAGGFRSSFISIEGREDITKLRYAGKRFVLSTPEYVSGLQFDIVFVLHPDAALLDSEDSGPRRKRLNVRRLYLAATRASKELHFACSDELGGKSRIFDHAISSQTIELSSKRE